ncbi:ClbS/DfsB family four-helix bundle protein [Candidatus Saccharibacteria bacterium]|nr:ClbS/DfsB family four-helix bundle protein [Candidatus Saccharibacteria bacterium]
MCGTKDQTPRDIIMHMYEWQKMLIDWHDKNMAGEKVSFLPDGFNWGNYSELNDLMWENYQNVTLDEAKKLLAKSHAEVMKRIRQHNDEELFTKKYYDWTGTTNLGSYFISAMGSHYDWAAKQLKKMGK